MLIAAGLAAALVIKIFVVQTFYIPSSSVENTLHINDMVLVNKLVYHFRPIARRHRRVRRRWIAESGPASQLQPRARRICMQRRQSGTYEYRQHGHGVSPARSMGPP